MKKQAKLIENLSLTIDSLGNYLVKSGKVELLAVPVERTYDNWNSISWTIVTSTGIRLHDVWRMNDEHTNDKLLRFMFDFASNAYELNRPEPEKVEELEETTLEEVAGRN